MGIRQSAIKLPPINPDVPLFALTFRKPHTITLVLADSNVINLVTRVCTEMWKKGFVSIGKNKDDSYQLVFKGHPFVIGKRQDHGENMKRICCRLLSELYALGYECVLASDLSRYTDFTTWFFEQRAAPDHAPAPIIVCLAFSSTDRLQLFNGNELLKKILRDTVIESYGPGIEDEQYYDEGTDDEYYEMKLCGTPWQTTSFDLSIWVRKMILAIFGSFYKFNYKYYTSANLNGAADSVFFVYEPDDIDFRQSMIRQDRAEFCLISLNGNNRLRLLNCTSQMIEATKKAIIEKWPYGFKRQLNVADGIVREFEMGGQPWLTSDADGISSRAFMAQLFESLLALGWRVVCSLDISRKMNDKSIFILQSRSPATRRFFCVSFNDRDKIRVILAKPDVALMVEKSVNGNWPKGIKRELDYFNSREIKLKGTPFEPLNPNEASLVRALMCYLLHRLHKTGCRVVASSDVSAKYQKKGNGPNFPFDVHAWFVSRKD